ncbi:MAG: alpha/beta fold hydrolase [Alphaproteobacteria bacterium]
MAYPTNTLLEHVPADYCPKGSENWFTLTEGYDAGKTLFYYDHTIGDGAPETTVLFVHGNPENSYTWWHTRDELIASGKPLRLIAMDHVGFGLSDQADFEMIDMHHAQNLAQLVQHLDLRDVTLVTHDWGGPIGVGAFLDQPERVKALMVCNTTIFPMPDEGYTYTNFPYPYFPWIVVGYIVPQKIWGGIAAALVREINKIGFNAFNKVVAANVWKYLRRAFEPGSAEYVFSEQFRSKANAVASKRHVRHTPTWGHGYTYKDKRHGVQDNHAFTQRIQNELVPAWQGLAAAGVFGEWDACGKPEVRAQWVDAFPAMKNAMKIVEDGGHFIEESEGPAIAAAILKMNGL